ncbi:MAG: AraC family transcriptional regulator ligand-binding domain-containing protein [Bacteroidia bacterium]
MYDLLMEQISLASDDQHFGLHMGQHMSLSAAGLVYQIVQSSRTVREALHYCAEFAMLGCSSIPVTIEEEDDSVRMIFRPVGAWAQYSETSLRHTLDGMLVFSLREFHSLSLYKEAPLAVYLERKEADKDYLESIFECPVRTDMAQNAIIFSKEQADQPVISSNYRLLQLLVDFAGKKLQQDEQTASSFSKQVKRCILNMIKPAFPTIEQVASHLNMSVRSLQRKLKAEGKTFQELLENLRKDAAKNYLQNEDMSVGEVSFLLGYAEPSTFVRAFKRWTGLAPGKWKDEGIVNSELGAVDFE